MNIGTITAKLELVTSAFDKAISDADRKMWETGKRLTATISAPIAGATTAIFAAAKKQGEWAEQLGNLSKSTGLSTTKLQELKYAADVSGLSFDALTGTTTVLQRKLLGIEEGSGPAAEAMKQLGVSIKGPDGQMRSMNDLFPELISKLQAVENPTLKNALATQLFGRNLADVAPLLNMTKEELKGLFDQAHKSGNILSPEQIERAQKFDDQLDAIVGRLKGSLMQITAMFLGLPGPVQTALVAIGGIAFVIGPIMQTVVAVKALATMLGPLKLAFASTWAAALGPIALVIAAIAAVGGAAYLIYRYWEPIKAFFGKLWDGVKTTFVAAWEFLKNLFLNYTPEGLLFKHWDTIKDYFAKLWDAVYDATVGRLTKLFSWIWDQVKAAGRWFGFGAEAGTPAAPAPKAASASAGGSGAGRGDFASREGGRDGDIVAELKKISANTQKKAYA